MGESADDQLIYILGAGFENVNVVPTTCYFINATGAISTSIRKFYKWPLFM